ncbi:MAG: MarR family winged helix-turn-helix transcriptional regulator [Dehalococcoidia bacterium]|nr:MarR family winged helix-turn-helix transcriptional regulator [Dehalococcoidia bacterium]
MRGAGTGPQRDEREFPPSRLELRAAAWVTDGGLDEGTFFAAYNLNSAGQLLLSSLNQAMQRAVGITYEAWRILWLLQIVPSSEPRRLAHTLWLSRPAVTAALNRLEQLGLVTRQRAANDRRLVVVESTPAGIEAAERGRAAYVELVRQFFEGFTAEEQETMSRLARAFWRLNYEPARRAGMEPKVRPAVVALPADEEAAGTGGCGPAEE